MFKRQGERSKRGQVLCMKAHNISKSLEADMLVETKVASMSRVYHISTKSLCLSPSRCPPAISAERWRSLISLRLSLNRPLTTLPGKKVALPQPCLASALSELFYSRIFSQHKTTHQHRSTSFSTHSVLQHRLLPQFAWLNCNKCAVR